MSRLTDLIARARAKDAALGEELEKEFKALSSRRAFGLNFERHKPESVELPGRPVRKGDKVRILPPRGSSKKGDQTVWKVLKISKSENVRIAELEQIEAENPQVSEVAVDDLVVVAEFRDYIYPGLISTGKVERGGDKPYHTVINGENFHVLEALTYTHRGKIDAIYIDPPYNTGAKDWKYNNDYVESEDLYRHSKWLAFIERRLLVARQLLNPDASALIVTIDEKEYLRLGLLLEQVFPEATIQMISSVINPKGSSRSGRFSRVDEYIYFVFFGDSEVSPWRSDMLREVEDKGRKVRWAGLMRNGEGSRRSRIPSMFFPIYIDKETGEYHSTGEPPPRGTSPKDIPSPEGTIPIWPIDRNGQEMMWRLSPSSFREYLEIGHAKFGVRNKKTGSRAVYYLQAGIRKMIESGEVVVAGKDSEGSLELEFSDSVGTRSPATLWNMVSHSASEHGSGIIKSLIPGRRFPYPKSLYAVEDCLRFIIGKKKDSIILDFFSGSGTTAHALMRLNRQDGGKRVSISVTNNEVAAEEQKTLLKSGHLPGDREWERLGICDYITKPRIQAAILGETPEGKKIEGDYKFTDEFPMADGFEENAEFFTLTYETPVAVRHNVAFKRIAPLLWMRAGSKGSRIERIPEQGWDVVEAYGVLVNLDQSTKFCKAIRGKESVSIAYIVTDDHRRFQAVARHLPDSVEPVRLYESYLSNFRFSMGR